MPREHVSATDGWKIISENESIFILSYIISTDGTNDVTLEIEDKNGPVTPIGGFTVSGTNDSGGASSLKDDSIAPIKARITGTGGTATITFRRIV